MSEKELQLRVEIKRLLKEAAALSQPSTFAQAVKLRRTAAAKEKELAKSQESLSKEMKTSFALYEKILLISKECIEWGVWKFNVSTEVRKAYMDALKSPQADLAHLMASAKEAMKAMVAEKLHLFGSAGKAR